MDIETIVTGQLQTNTYLVTDKVTQKAIVIDPGDSAESISEKILVQDLQLQSVVLTHGHFDHVLAAYELQLAFGVPVLLHKEDEKLLGQMVKSATYWLKREIVEKPPENLKFVNEGDVVRFGDAVLRVLHTPGHTPGGICLYSESIYDKVIFTGDTLFANGVGRTDLPYSNSEELEKSLKKLERFDGYQVYPGHEESFIF